MTNHDKAYNAAMFYYWSGKTGRPMPNPIEGKEIKCKNAFQLGEYHLMVETNTNYENLGELKEKINSQKIKLDCEQQYQKTLIKAKELGVV